MFTGIIEEIGRVEKIVPLRGLSRLVVRASKALKGLKLGDSISVNGTCLTVMAKTGIAFSVDVIPETLRRTSLGRLRPSAAVNLERALLATGRLDGHMVLGHVDAVGRVSRVIRRGGDVRMTVTPPKDLMKYIAMKGSVALEGVSLTVAKRTSSNFTVALVPFTISRTTLGKRVIGDTVNIEVDIIARYLENLR